MKLKKKDKKRKINIIKKFFSIGLGIFLFGSICLESGIKVCAEPVDYKAEAEARKFLPIASNEYKEWPNGPAIGAESAILMEVNTGTILYEKNIHEHMYPASVTKILTCLIGMENCEMDEEVKMSREAVFSIPRDSSNVGLDAGEVISVEQCLYAILVGSANEAANALGEHVSGSIGDFVELMNKRAKELGCQDSHFVTTNGLHDEEHYTSAYDLALIARKFFSNELLCKMSSTPTYYIPQSPTQPDDDLYIHSKNELYSKGKYRYDYLVGSKTGYTNNSRQTLVSCAQKDNMKLVCVILKEESPCQFTDTVELFDYGFNNFQTLNISDNETKYTIDNNNFFQTDNDIFGVSKPILAINEMDYVVLPVTAAFEDLESSLVYEEAEDEKSIATIEYTYYGMPVGKATVDLAEEDKTTMFDFESQLKEESLPTEEMEQKEDINVIFINVKKVIIYVVSGAGCLIFVFCIKAVFDNYQFAKRRKDKLRRKKKRRHFSSQFEDFDF